MHVAVDARSLRPGESRARGVARYLRCLLDALRSEFPEDRYTPVDPGRLRLAASALTGRGALDRLAPGCDVVWMPAPAPAAPPAGTPLVLTVHDLSFEHRPRDYPLYDRLWIRLARPARLARAAEVVLCVSDATRAAVIGEWAVEPERARTVRSGPGRAPTGATAEPVLGLPERYFLAVGALEPRKLPDVVAEAHRRARERGLGAGLVFAGDGPLRGELEAAGAIVLGWLPDELLEDLYSRALAVACVSREEGFGFAPLEAAARGTPAVVSDIPVFAETLGDAALRVPPGDPDALADALLQLENNPALSERLAERAQQAVSRLSWTEAARATRAALAEAAESRA
jgi:glycosyltransferase involved in cell wall biosynthesis